MNSALSCLEQLPGSHGVRNAEPITAVFRDGETRHKNRVRRLTLHHAGVRIVLAPKPSPRSLPDLSPQSGPVSATGPFSLTTHSMSPMASLPNDVLMLIFDTARLASIEDDALDACELGFALRTVSQRFRAVVDAMPQLWAKIYIRSADDKAYARMRACFRSSRSCPLDISYTVRYHASDHYSYDDHGGHFFTAMATEAHRLRRLYFSFSNDHERAAMVDAFRTLYVPQLEYLRIYIDHVSSDPIEPASIFDGGAPRLAETCYQGMGWFCAAVPVSALIKCVIDEPNASMLLGLGACCDIISRSPVLKSFTLTGTRFADASWTGSWTPGHPHHPPVICNQFEEFGICCQTEALLDIFRMPMLTALHFDSATMSKVLLFLINCSDPPFPRLQTLTLGYVQYPAPSELSVLFEKMPGIIQLRLKQLQLVTSDHMVMFSTLTQYPGAWPQLETIVISGADMEPLIALAKARSGSPLRIFKFAHYFVRTISRHYPSIVQELEGLGVSIKDFDTREGCERYLSSWVARVADLPLRRHFLWM